MLLLVKRSCFKCIPKDNEENASHERRQLGRLINKFANSKGVSVGCDASHVGRNGELALLLCFVKKRAFHLGLSWSLPLRNAVNLKPNAREQEAVLEEWHS